jgi:hypothetical protein
MASYVIVAFCHCLTILIVTISADAMVFLIQQRVLCGSVGILPCLFQFSADDHFGRSHGFVIQQRILCGSVGISPCLSTFLQMTISADAMAFFLFSSASSVEALAFCPPCSNFLSSLSFPLSIFCIDFPPLDTAAAA